METSPPFGSAFSQRLARPADGMNCLPGLTNVIGFPPRPARPIPTDDYLRGVLTREAVDTGALSPVRAVQATLRPIVSAWAGGYLSGLYPTGSFAKGTANRSGTSMDLFVSLLDSTPLTLKNIYARLFEWMQSAGYTPKRRNVSINVNVDGYDVDLTPARRQTALNDDHSLYRRKADVWTQTNVVMHINHVGSSGRLNEIRLLKLWRDQKRLAFPSFYLELSVLAALERRCVVPPPALADNLLAVLVYLRDSFPGARVVDPANANNVISDDLTADEKLKVKAAAERALSANDWNEIVV